MNAMNSESVFKLRIVNVDYYLNEPIIGLDDNYSQFRESTINKVPIIRIFGTTPKGEKTCLHIHGVYPYLSIPFVNYHDFGTNDSSKRTYFNKLVNELEASLMPSRVQTKNKKNNDSVNDQQIYCIEEIDAIPFYGFHKNCHKFLRIYFYNPSVVKKASEILISGAIMDRIIQPFESHIPYILQFFINNNLHGMNFIEAKKIHFRKTKAQIDNLNYLDVDPISSCELECDINFEDIINRELLSENKRNPGLEAIWTEEINRCKNSQELLNLNGIPSQERSNIPLAESETYHFDRLYQGLSALNIEQDIQCSNSSQFSSTSDSSQMDFAKMIVQCIRDNNDSDDGDSDSSINNEMSQRLEDVITESQKARTNTRNSSKNINLRSTNHNSTEDSDSDCTIIDEIEFNVNEVIENANSCADAETQTSSLEDSIDSCGFVNLNHDNNDEEEIEEVLCDCESDECCDQCCDQGSDQCECDCEKCQYEKSSGCKRIPQIDGAFDDDSSDFSPDYRDNSDDSDCEVSKKKTTKETGPKRTHKSKCSTSAKKKKSLTRRGSDSSDMEFTNSSNSFTISKPGPASKKKHLSAAVDSSPSISITSLDQNDSVFESNNRRKLRNSHRLASKLLSHSKRKRRSGSPIHMSFSESEASDKSERESGLDFLSIADFSYSTSPVKTNSKRSSKAKRKFSDDRSERSTTPYLSNDSDDEIVPKTRPGPKSSKASDASKPSPKSSKAGSKSSRTSSFSKHGSKSSKSPNSKPPPKSSKANVPKSTKTRNSISPQSDLFSDSTMTRSRRSAAKNVNYDDKKESISTSFSSILSDVKAKPTNSKTKRTPKNKSALDSPTSSCNSSPNKKSPLKRKTESYISDDYELELVWKSFNNIDVQIDKSYYNEEEIDTIGNEELDIKKMPSYKSNDFLSKYIENIDYWSAEKTKISTDLAKGLLTASGNKTTTRSKAALKEFYTSPHLNGSSTTKTPTKTLKPNPRHKSNEFARLIADASHLIGKPLGRRTDQISKNKAKSITPAKPVVRKSLPRRGSDSAKSKGSEKKTTKSTKSPKLKTGVTSSTLFTTTSIPFYESDIRVVTQLTGNKKRQFLKSLCEDFELKTEKLSDDYLINYKNKNVSPFLFENIYYNDYSGYLSDEESEFAQDVIITMKKVIDDVVSVSQCVDSLLFGAKQQLDPKPMIDTREDYFEQNNHINEDHWDYGHYADEPEYQGLQEIGLEDRDDVGVNEGHVEASNGRIVANEEQNDMKTNNEQKNQNEFEENCEFQVKNRESDCNVNSSGVEHDNEDNDSNSGTENNSENENNSDRDHESENEAEYDEQNCGEEVNMNCEPYDIGRQVASEEFSPSSAHSGEYSNNDSNQYLAQRASTYQNQANGSQMQSKEDGDQSNSSSSNSAHDNSIPPDLPNMGITDVRPNSNEQDFKMQTTYGSEVFGYNVNTSLQQPYQQIENIQTVPTAIVSPMIPTVMETQNDYSHETVYTQQQNWSPNTQMNVNEMPINETAFNMPNVDTNQNTINSQQETEFDLTNYSYMPYYSSNPNIPQFDGIFDDDSFQSEGNQFNMNCKSDKNIEHLSQGSRSEEMSVTSSGQRRISTDLVSFEENRVEASLRSRRRDDKIERYYRSINGVVVDIPQSIPEAILQQFGREVLVLDRLKIPSKNDPQNHEDVFNEDDSKLFYKTSLNGLEKFNYLQSLCRQFNVTINRLNFDNLNDSTLKNFTLNQSQTSVSSFSIDNSLNNKNVCVENDSNASLLSINNTPFEKEVPQTNCDSDETIVDDSNSGIYSFYLDETPSLTLSQSSPTSTKSQDKSIDDISSFNSYNHHSTPLGNKKCKPLSDLMDKSEVQLSGQTQQTSQGRRESFEKFKFDDSMTPKDGSSPPKDDPNPLKDTPKQSYDSIIDGPTPSNTYNFAISSASTVNDSTAGDNSAEYEYQYLTTMSVEVHVSTRADLNPDPNFDNIEVIFYSISNDYPPDSGIPKSITGLIAVEADLQSFRCTGYSPAVNSTRKLIERSGYSPKDVKIDYADDEFVLLMNLVDIVKQWDPDIIVGYQIDTLSWGYVLQRANVLNMSIMTPLSRINDEKYSRNFESSANNTCHLSGRISMNLWHIMRHEVTLNVYSYENVHYHVLHERIPHYDYKTLTQWYSDPNSHLNRRRVMEHYVTRVRGTLRLLDKLDFIDRNSELARIFGIQFSEVFNRGSQFRVESIMLRFTKQFNYIAVSPCPRQVANMKAPESLPLILEPESKYYTDPVAVLDFQSLYPSMMIAYNYCYSTCLGRVDNLIDANYSMEFGCTNLEIKKNLLLKYQNDIHFSPNGVVFLKEYIRRGILPKMLEEILNTRIMVKNAIKANNKKKNPNKALHRKLDARQLGLKLIANVTYGYTGANFSGRMPCVEIADAIVSKGRETLERAIDLIQSEPKWKAKVIYGDTDSMFVLFPGCSKEEAFKRGQEIAEAVTAINPKPVKLKFEKVYLPCVLQTKKRYIGFMYESLQQTIPVFDAKGIETVRRDTCPAVAKMLEKSLKILFTTNHVNGVKMYLLRQFQKILEGRVSLLNDFIFAREYRGKDNYSKKTHVPSMRIAKRRLYNDVRSEPKIDERVPYVIVCGPPNQPLFRLVKEPLELIRDPSLRLNSVYYIERVIIPSLNRVFQLMGHDVMKWYKEMPRKTTYNRYQYLLGQGSKARTIPQFFNTTNCVVCEANSMGKDLCDNCSQTPQDSVIGILDKMRDLQKKYSAILQVCKSCNASNDHNLDCISIDCPNLYRFHQTKLDYMNVNYLNNVLKKF